MRYHIINSPEDQLLPFVAQLYHEAFPAQERRAWDRLLAMIGTQEEMFVTVALAEEQAVGFVIFWLFGDWCFIEYLAIDPAKRGMKLGEEVMRHLGERPKMILEVEPPSAGDAARRVRFYERLGLRLLPYPYRQPSYHEAGVFYDMKLMSNLPSEDMQQFDWIIHEILEKIYGLK